MNYDNLSETEMREIARKRVEAKQGFKIHLTVYILVNLGLWTLCLFVTPHEGGIPWALYPTLGWGIGLTIHFLGMISELRGNDSDAINREIERMKRK